METKGLNHERVELREVQEEKVNQVGRIREYPGISGGKRERKREEKKKNRRKSRLNQMRIGVSGGTLHFVN